MLSNLWYLLKVVPKLVKFYIYCHEIDCLLHTKFFNEKFFSVSTFLLSRNYNICCNI